MNSVIIMALYIALIIFLLSIFYLIRNILKINKQKKNIYSKRNREIKIAQKDLNTIITISNSLTNTLKINEELMININKINTNVNKIKKSIDNIINV